MTGAVSVSGSAAGLEIEFSRSGLRVHVQRNGGVLECLCRESRLDIDLNRPWSRLQGRLASASAVLPWSLDHATGGVLLESKGVPFLRGSVTLPAFELSLRSGIVNAQLVASRELIAYRDLRLRLVDLGGVTSQSALLVTGLAIEEQFLATTNCVVGALSVLSFAQGFESSLTESELLRGVYSASHRLRRKGRRSNIS